jgi:exopolysaccharide biosynthesis protein
VAEGRTALSGGLTLEELAGYLLKMGARDALNFDGGGSSGMVVRNEQVNTPPDGSERLIRSGLAVVRRQVRLPK